VRILLAVEWMLATAAALALTHLAVEIGFAALLGYALLVLLPFIGGAVAGLPVGVSQWLILRGHVEGSERWILYTLIGFAGAWTTTMILAAVLFVPSFGLTGPRAFLSLAIPAPIIGWAQTRAIRHWAPATRLWLIASTAGWVGFVAVETFGSHALPLVSRLTGTLVSRIAGYAVTSSVGTTVLAGAVAGAVTGVALAMTLPARSPRSK